MTKAFGYMRTSSAANVGEDKDSETRQRLAIQGYADANGIEIAGWFYDAKVKPENTGNPERDLLRKMMRTGVKLPSARWHREILKQRRAKKVGS
jgi:DNA invertase Pin-like site-specific DNA recombinase